MLIGVALLLEVVKILVAGILALAVLAVVAVGTRAVWLEQVRRYDRTHGRRIAGGLGGRRR